MQSWAFLCPAIIPCIHYEWLQLKQGVSEGTPERKTARIALRGLQQGKEPDEILKYLSLTPPIEAFRHISGKSQRSHIAAMPWILR
jgi:hypothetical protein